MPKVTAAQFQKQFGAFSETAQRTPVTITKHGRDSLVLMSVEDYERLKSFDTRKAFRIEDAPQEFVDAIAEAEPPAWTDQFNDEVEKK